MFVDEVPVNPASQQCFEGSMPEIVITIDKVHEALLYLNVNSAVGPDDVHPRVLRCAAQMSVPLAIIFKRSLCTGLLPRIWLKSIVVATIVYG